jgi:hypothetical protein
MADKLWMADKAVAGLNAGAQVQQHLEAPYFMARMELHPAAGATYHGWTDLVEHNTVQNTGRFHALNHIFGQTGGACNTWYLGLHSNAGTDTTFNAVNITSAEISLYTTAAGTSTRRWSVSFASNMNTFSTSFGATYVFYTNTQQTVSGPFLAGGGANATQGQATGSDGTNCVLYSLGAFAGGAKTVNQNDTLNVTVTLSVA